MSLSIHILSGPHKNLKIPVSEDLVIGRSLKSGKILDESLSEPHAKVSKNNAGQFILQDLGSKNGLLLDDQKIPSILIFPGLVLKLGSLLIEIVESSGTEVAKTPVIFPKTLVHFKEHIPEGTSVGESLKPLLIKPKLELKVLSFAHLKSISIYYTPKKLSVSSLSSYIEPPSHLPLDSALYLTKGTLKEFSLSCSHGVLFFNENDSSSSLEFNRMDTLYWSGLALYFS